MESPWLFHLYTWLYGTWESNIFTKLRKFLTIALQSNCCPFHRQLSSKSIYQGNSRGPWNLRMSFFSQSSLKFIQIWTKIPYPFFRASSVVYIAIFITQSIHNNGINNYNFDGTVTTESYFGGLYKSRVSSC